ncbi:hypothetical protein K469DRAFT_718983 [Zopfia rhizophila CBS 207.26]|uniref:Uncharacterized protein n=1 Tax=Zopfia rhizophila CBS 207.26 TaxID=1314779 RepID=A0A6A6EIL7_9PEZI|nr:hypothetical protein K469DRAFT_718983 [Zopfia rhizophila CBS 207.26]
MSSSSGQVQVRPNWAVDTIVTQVVPAVQVPDPFITEPRPPLAPPTGTLQGYCISIGTMFGTERDPDLAKPYVMVNTAVRLYVRCHTNSNEMWVLCHFTQTTGPDPVYLALSQIPSAPHATAVQQVQLYTFTWMTWNRLTDFMQTTFQALRQRHFRTIPNPSFAQLPDQHLLFDGAWKSSSHPAHADRMTDINVRAWTPNINRITTVYLEGPNHPRPQLSQAQVNIWFNNIAVNVDQEDDDDE